MRKAIIHRNRITRHSVESICKSVGMCRSAYYKSLNRQKVAQETENKVLQIVHKRRAVLSSEGGRKLYVAIKPTLEQQNLKVGRDKLFSYLRQNNLLIYPRKSFVHTTNSRHRFKKYINLIKDIQPDSINQIWVADITYIRTLQGFCFLAIITDMYSRKIVGFDVSKSLELEGALRALKFALRSLPDKHKLIHHSDRGIQYCSNPYIHKLKENEIKISMTQENHCYENSIAERVNGILKSEFFLNSTFKNLNQATIACKNAINLYNNVRLHVSLKYNTPEYVYRSA